MKPYVVTALTDGTITETGDLIEMVLTDEDGKEIPLRFDIWAMERFMARAAQMLSEAQNRRSSTAGHLGIQAAPVADIVATAPVGGRSVILSVRLTNGLVYHLALILIDRPDCAPKWKQPKQARENRGDRHVNNLHEVQRRPVPSDFGSPC